LGRDMGLGREGEGDGFGREMSCVRETADE